MDYTFYTGIPNLAKHDCSYSCMVPLVFWRAGSALPITLSELVEDNNGRMKADILWHCCWKPTGHSTPQWSRPANESVVSFLPSLGVMVHGEVMNAGLSVRLWEQGRGMFEAHLVHSWRGGTGTGRVEMQTEISRGAIKEGRRDSVSIKGIVTLPLFDNLATLDVVFSFHLNWRAKGLWICWASLGKVWCNPNKTHKTPITFHPIIILSWLSVI